MNTPLISIALCTYNGERFLGEQLGSLLAQDYPRIEIVAVDDASTDASFRLLESRGREDSRLRALRNPHTLGFRRNFEQAIGACRGDWIALSDQDDVWLPDKLSTLLRDAGEADLVYCDSELIDEQGRDLGHRVSDRYSMYSGADPRAFTFLNCVSGHALMFRRELATRALPVPDGVYHDWWLAFAAANGRGLRYVDRPLVRFRQHTRNLSAFTGAARRDTRLEQQERETRALAALAAFRGAQQPFFASLLARWRARRGQWFCWALAALLWRHRQAVFALKKSPPALKWRHVLKYLPGLRVQQLFERSAP